MTFIINPISGTVKGKNFKDEILQLFPTKEYKIKIIFTKFRGHASDVAKNLFNYQGVVVVAGGDGTINEVAKELLYSETVSLGIIPMGSGNGLARSLGISLNLKEALLQIKHGKNTLIDTCSFNGQPFFCTAGIGFDALVAKDFDELPQRGLKTYFQASFRQFIKYKGTAISTKINGTKSNKHLFMIAVANANQYGYGAKINPISSLTDGKMEIVMVDNMSFPEFAEFTFRLFLGTIQNFRNSKIIQSENEIVIESESRIAHLDGEPVAFNGRALINIHPNSLRLII